MSLLAQVHEFDLATFVAEAPITVTPEPLPRATGQDTRPLRAGYAGHLIRIANKLQERARRDPAVAEKLDANEKWLEFARTTLEECNRNDDIEGWECGRPSQDFTREEEDA
eukprot:scaffold293613_cov47-Prasinocladus_malaysianus.AAC.1